jgi:PhzF family phenazine biosynthesis protein
MQIPLYQVDAFTSEVFRGNPAAVCPLEFWLPAHTMQCIAAENNLAETAFFVKEGDHYGLRWFTPTVEVDLCGHATLASAFVLFHYLNVQADSLRFDTRSGELTVRRNGDRLTLNFPSLPATRCDPPQALIEGLGAQPLEILKAGYYLVVYPDAEDVRSLQPRMETLKGLGVPCIVTAPGRDCDFVSRFFAPSHGIDEDPVTGSAHCTLIPYWSRRLGKNQLFARQLSARGGELWCEDLGDRVLISGHAVGYLEGRIQL